MIAKTVTWNVTSLNGAEPFDVTGSNLEEAVCTALVALGWTISPSLVKSEPNDEYECPHCGRVYDDSNECLSDDCPSKDELVTSSDVLALSKSHNLKLEFKFACNFWSSQSLSSDYDGYYSHQITDGDINRVSTEDFLRIYPDSLGKVWRVERKTSVAQKPLTGIDALFLHLSKASALIPIF